MSATAVALIVVLFVLWHALLWCGLCWLLGRLGGWQALALRYPRQHVHASDAPAGSGMLMIGESWNGSIRAWPDDDGIVVQAAPLMRFGHRPLMFPWSDITRLPDTHSPIVRSTHIALAGRLISFYGAAAAVVSDALLARSPDGGME